MLTAWIDDFAEYLRTVRRYSAHTVDAYVRDIRQFAEWVVEQHPISEWKQVRPQDIQDWIIYLARQGTHARTIQRKRSALSTFFRFLRKEGVVEQNPVLGLALPKAPHRVPEFIPEDQLLAILQKLKPQANADWTAWRDWLLVILPVALGLRVSELCELTDRDIDFGRLVVRIFGKGKKVREVPIGYELARQIQYYQLLRNQQWSDAPTLLLTDAGQAIYPRWVQRRLKVLLADVPHPHPHLLRHTFATLLLNHGAELLAIKEFLGHASLAATQVYTHASIEQLKKQYQNTHPLNQLNSSS